MRRHDWKRESTGRFVYHKRCLLAIRVKIRLGVRQLSIKDGWSAAQGTPESNHPSELAGGGIVTTPGCALGDEEAGWDFGNLSVWPSGGVEQLLSVLSCFSDIVSQWGMALP